MSSNEKSVHNSQWSYHGAVNTEDSPNGRGLKTWTGDLCRHKYEGEFIDGRMQGRGSFAWPHAARYHGEWCDNARNGRGLMWLGDGKRCFQGDWTLDLPMIGTGVDPDGSIFLADFSGDEPLGDHSWLAAERTPVGRFLNWPPSEYAPGGPRGPAEWRATVVLRNGTRFEGDMIGLCPKQGVETAVDGEQFRVTYSGKQTIAEEPQPLRREVLRPRRRALFIRVVPSPARPRRRVLILLLRLGFSLSSPPEIYHSVVLFVLFVLFVPSPPTPVPPTPIRPRPAPCSRPFRPLSPLPLFCSLHLPLFLSLAHPPPSILPSTSHPPPFPRAEPAISAAVRRRVCRRPLARHRLLPLVHRGPL